MATSTKHELHIAVSQLLLNLPEALSGYFWSAKHLEQLLVAGGLSGLPQGIVEETIHLQRSLHGLFAYDRVKQIRFYRFGDPRPGINCLIDQHMIDLPSPEDMSGYFVNETNLQSLPDLQNAVNAIRRITAGSTDASNQDLEQQQVANNSIVPTTNVTTAENDGNIDDDDHCDDDDNDQDSLSTAQQLAQWHGLQIFEVDLLHSFIEQVQSHNIQCQHKLEPGLWRKKGFDFRQEWTCASCNHVVLFCGGRDIPNNNNQEGDLGGHGSIKPSELNRLVAAGTFNSGISNQKMIEFCAETGLNCPARSALQSLRETVKKAAKAVSEEQLQRNR